MGCFAERPRGGLDVQRLSVRERVCFFEPMVFGDDGVGRIAVVGGERGVVCSVCADSGDVAVCLRPSDGLLAVPWPKEADFVESLCFSAEIDGRRETLFIDAQPDGEGLFVADSGPRSGSDTLPLPTAVI